MTFAVAAEAYDRFVGRYGTALGSALAAAAGVRPGMRALDVGCGTGALTRVLSGLLGPEHVAAVDPSEPFVAAVSERLPEVDVRVASAESLPFPDGVFDAALAQLVFNFLQDPDAGLAELRRVTAPGGIVAACVWDYPGEMTLLRAFWEAATALDPDGAGAVDERTRMPLAREGELADLWRRGGLEDVEEGRLIVSADYQDFEELWSPLESGVAPAGAYTASLDEERRSALAAEYRRRLGVPPGRFTLGAHAWYAVGRT